MAKSGKSPVVVRVFVARLLDIERRSERRRRERLKISLPARLRPFDSRCVPPEEVQTTLNFNRCGLYFATPNAHYCLGMRLLVTYPYYRKGCQHREYVGEVVRLQHLADGRQGVALQFLS